MAKLKAKKKLFEGNPVWKIWTVEVNGRKFEIDGQNHAETTREWEIFEIVDGDFGSDLEWVETMPTKSSALELIEEITA